MVTPAASPGRRFAIRYSRALRPFLVLIGLGPRRSWVELGAAELTVRMGWGFNATVPRSAIRSARRQPDWWLAIGIHTNLRGTWLVNGSPKGLVAMDLEPAVAGRCMGLRVRVRRLGASLEDPDGFLAALNEPAED